ncbi:MAG: hypothetical protein LLG02_16490 [Pelosinus sp.]|nr:hypothetical protein [Pelosinus sp.]
MPKNFTDCHTLFPEFSNILTGSTSACFLLLIWFLFFAADCPPVCCCRPTCLPDKCSEDCL